MKLLLIFALLFSVVAHSQFGSNTTVYADFIQQNDNGNLDEIVITPGVDGFQISTETANRACYLDANKAMRSSSTTSAQLDFINSLSSNAQNQIDAKLTSPLTTNGDVMYYNSSLEQRLAIGAVNQVLTVISGLPTWQNASTISPLTTKGDVFGYTTIDARIPVGSNDQVLTADSTQALGVAWKNVPGSQTVVTKTASTTLLDSESVIICDTASSEVTLTLPTAVSNSGLKYQVTMKAETNKCIIDGDGTETIGSALTRELYESNNSITIISDGVNWFILERTATISVQGASNAGTVLTANTTNIDFTETRDKSQSYNGTQFTSPEGGTYCAKGIIQLTTNTGLVIKAYLDGSFSRRAGFIRGTTNSNGLFEYCNFLNKGSVLSFRVDQNVTLAVTSTDHWIAISRVD